MSSKKRLFTQRMFNIEIFRWAAYERFNEHEMYYYNIVFPFKSMEKYNDHDCSLNTNGYLKVYKEPKVKLDIEFFKTDIVWEGFISDIPEFREELNKKYNRE